MLLLTLLYLPRVSAAVAQVPAEHWHRIPLVDPLVGGQFDVGLGLGVTVARPARGRPWLADGAFTVLGQYGIDGSRTLTAIADAPGLRAGWRLLGMARTERLLRTPYFGAHDEARRNDSLVNAFGDRYYRYALLRSTLFLTAQRRLAGPLWLHLAAQARHYRTSAIRQRSLFGDDVAAGRTADTLRHNGIETRLGVFHDTRDDWIVPTSGHYVEVVGAAGWLVHDAAGTSSYQRMMIGGREYYAFSDSQTVLALRQRISLARDTLPFYLAWEQLTTWTPDDGVVGSHFVRLHRAGVRLASNDAILSFDVRRQVAMIGTDPAPVRLWVLLLGDVGLLWEPHTRPTAQQGQWTLGAGFRLQPNRAALVGIDFGMTDIGFNLSAVSRFAF